MLQISVGKASDAPFVHPSLPLSPGCASQGPPPQSGLRAQSRPRSSHTSWPASLPDARVPPGIAPRTGRVVDGATTPPRQDPPCVFFDWRAGDVTGLLKGIHAPVRRSRDRLAQGRTCPFGGHVTDSLEVVHARSCKGSRATMGPGTNGNTASGLRVLEPQYQGSRSSRLAATDFGESWGALTVRTPPPGLEASVCPQTAWQPPRQGHVCERHGAAGSPRSTARDRGAAGTPHGLRNRPGGRPPCRGLTGHEDQLRIWRGSGHLGSPCWASRERSAGRREREGKAVSRSPCGPPPPCPPPPNEEPGLSKGRTVRSPFLRSPAPWRPHTWM